MALLSTTSYAAQPGAASSCNCVALPCLAKTKIVAVLGLQSDMLRWQLLYATQAGQKVSSMPGTRMGRVQCT